MKEEQDRGEIEEKSDPELDYSLVGNGLDFINEAISDINSEEINRLKYVILNLFSGTMLIMKERIRMEHWSLICKRPDKIDVAKFKAGDFEGINYQGTKDILTKICQIKIDDDYLTALNNLQKLRNKIEHFQFSTSKDAILPTVVKVLHFIIDFTKDYINSGIEDTDEGDIFKEIIENVREFDAYVDEKIMSIKKNAEVYRLDLFHCPACLDESLLRDGDDFYCELCGLEDVDIDEIVNTHMDIVLHVCDLSVAKYGSQYPNFDCPECGRDLSVVPLDLSYVNYKCVSCGESFSSENVSNCISCGVLFCDQEDGYCMCPSCFCSKL